MRRPGPAKRFLALTLVSAAVIVYGCLYPFHFYSPANGVGPLRTFAHSWAEWHGRGDLLSNILLYMPLGFFAVLSIRGELAAGKRVLLAMLAGAALSLSVELTQYYDIGRTTAAVDFYWNVLGTALGAGGGCIVGRSSGSAVLRAIQADLASSMLLGAWLVYRLFSYLPATDPRDLAFQAPRAGELLLDTVVWLTAGALLAAILGRSRFRLWFPLLAAAVLAARAPIAGVASATDMIGAGLAYLWLLWFGHMRAGAVVVALLIAAAVMLQLPTPGAFRGSPGQFGWMPFASYAKGSERDVISFLQKCFLYGGAIRLLGEAGLGLAKAAGLVAMAVLVIAWGQARLIGLPAESSDTVIALLMAAFIKAVGADDRSSCGTRSRTCYDASNAEQQ